MIAWAAATTGQDARRTNEQLTRDLAIAQAQQALAQAHLANAPPETIAALEQKLADAQTMPLLSYSQYGRQFTNWDGYRYEEIAEKGYLYHQPTDPPEVRDDSGMILPGWPERRLKNVSWYPLYPVMGWCVARLTGLSVNHSLTAISWISCALAALVTFALTRRRFLAQDPLDAARADAVAFWTLALLLAGPCAIFLYANFTESLFLLLLAAFLYCLDRRWWWRAALVAAAASACRSQGVLFGPILALCFLLRRPIHPPLKSLAIAFVLGAISGIGIGCYMLYLQIHFHDPLAFMHAQKYWTVGLGPKQLATALNPFNALHHIATYATGAQPGITHGTIDWPRLWEALCLLWPPIFLILGRRRLSLEFTLIAWILWALPYISNSHAGSSEENPSHWMSMGRFMAVLIPAYFIVAQTFARRPRLALTFLIAWSAAFALFAYKYGTGAWIG